MTLRTASALLAVLLAPAVLAQSAAPAPAAKPAAKGDIRSDISKKFPGATPGDVRQSPVTGVWEVMVGTDVVYVSSDAKYLIAGDLYDMNDQNSNLSEQRRRVVRQRMMATVPDSETLVFAPKAIKYTVTVFTDVDCGYCRQLHNQIARYNDLGIKVRYMFFPRSGPETESWHKAEQVWCSPNRNDALTRVKRGEVLKAPNNCGSKQVERDYKLGQDVGLRGTPGIVLPNGELLPGYMPPINLLAKLQKVDSNG